MFHVNHSAGSSARGSDLPKPKKEMSELVTSATHRSGVGRRTLRSFPQALRREEASETLEGQRPPLSCRTSPPHGGRSAVISAFANGQG
ncbi:hypothetical protein BQ8482_20092 [Mesorhizobium delmotii]|uniref:Uncharacterized protein n=1 Tax=Mesorhizobium delmotii TaxID=1631247 RepID=A0A2P9AK66_9HYPH|nr:hypothetical protein BQ8482_20092 [Mesorhizobium delmotii]